MNRCLHITINERPGAQPRRTTPYLPGRSGTDPEENYVMPDPDDPEENYVMPDPDDPEEKYVMPDPDDPSRRYFPTYGSGGWGTAVMATPACSCAPVCQGTATGKAATSHPFIGPRDYSGFVIVRMAPGIESGAETLWKLAEEHTLTGLQAVLELPVKAKANGEIPEAQPDKPPQGTLDSKPLVELHGPLATEFAEADAAYQTQLSREEMIHELERRTTSTAFPPLHSLASYWRLDLRQHPDLVEEAVARLNSLPEVGLAYRELAATDPQDSANGLLFSEDQGYLGDAPTGISASWARERLPPIPQENRGEPNEPPSKKLTLCDLEQAWNLDHKDLKDLVVGPLFGLNRAQADNSLGHHGTAVLGQLAAAGSDFGVQGVAAGRCRFVVTSHYNQDGSNGHVAKAIARALVQPLEKGDILLIEVQRGKLPAEVDEADFNAIRLATSLGIIVVEAAGNGGFDLDAYSDPATGRSLRRGDPRFQDSGAILVGAARAGLPHDRAPFSNYGSRLDCFGRGEAVTTCGYGDLAGTGVTDFYTNRFSGTSSASPIIAGAAALLQSLHETHTGERLKPQAMREILADPTTGTRQGPNVPGNIGVMPDLKAIVRDRLQLVPNVYLRRSIGDDGAPPAPGDEISSSPDIFVWPNGPKETSARWGEGSQRENTPAPGGPIKAGYPNNLYIRLRNRGLGVGDAHVQLFASPAATLITPERWIPVGAVSQSIPQDGIPQGDTLFVAGPVRWTPPSLASLSLTPAPPWSFLAVLTRPCEGPSGPLGPPWFDWTSGLPPGSPYFDWAEYRAFLRGPGVAWRNTHRVSATSPELAFCITGTPDRARHFDFEVIQRLPAGTMVTFTVPDALTAKLRQRQLWIGDGSEALVLPKRPRTSIRGVELAAGAYAGATFRVEGSALTSGHSLAIRQLWRGQEVGRITWFFGPHT